MGEEGKKIDEVKEKKQEDLTKAEKKPSELDGKKPEDAKAEPSPPPPPQEIVLRVFMHCEGCARKVKRCLKGFEGVEEVITDCKSSKVVVKGEKADPLKVLQRIQKKSHRQVELISPIPKPESQDEPKKPAEKEVVVKPASEKKEEDPVVVTVVLGIYMHCDACAQEIKKRIERMKGVENAEPDLKSSQVTVKGVFEPEKLTDYVFKRTGKHATVLKVEPEKNKEEKSEKDEKKPGETEKSKDEGAVAENKSDVKETQQVQTEAEVDDPKLEMRRNDLYYNYPQNYQLYPQMFVQEMNAYPPQMFSDENPNACSVM